MSERAAARIALRQLGMVPGLVLSRWELFGESKVDMRVFIN
jgi:hypothetical protein